MDTKGPAGPRGGPALQANVTRAFPIAGTCGTSSAATLLDLKLWVQATANGSLTVWDGTTPVPAAALTYKAKKKSSVRLVVKVGAGGSISVRANQASGTADLQVDVYGYEPPPNQAPLVNAGADQSVTLPASASLAGAASDDGLPAGGALTTQWSKLSGPGAVTFAAPGAPATTASFDTAGAYVLRLTAMDGQASASDDVAVSVAPAGGGGGGGGSLYVTSLVPESGTTSLGSGTSTLRLSADQTQAVVAFTYTNLSTALTGAHVHGPADPGTSGSILFDFDESPRQEDGSFVWVFQQVGTTTPAQIVEALKAGRLYVNLHTSRYPTGEIRGHYRAAGGSAIFTPPPAPPPLPGGPPTDADAARFLTQATFGATEADIADVKQRGFTAWIDEQLSLPAQSHLAFLDAQHAAGIEVCDDTPRESFYTQLMTRNDQLRQRLAFALSEILVVSDETSALSFEPYGLAAYMDVLGANAFGTYRQLLQAVTLSPSMGVYLDMLGNDKEDPATGRIPNENYAREILQLFSIGLYQLHPDGSLKLDAQGLPMPTYNQDVIVGFAHAFTGWSFGGNPTTEDAWWWPEQSWRVPMQAWPAHHSTLAKQILNGVVLPSGQTPQKDLADALDAIANHPNVGPFLARRLIQRLVTSNPSRGYVYRVAQAFENNGQGVRGDLRAVVRAILVDWEARAVETLSQQGYGKQREPVIRLANLLRAFRASAPSGRFKVPNTEDAVWGLGQWPYHARSVFNFFEPDFSQPGAIAEAGLASPELQITTETQAIGSTNYLHLLTDYGLGWEEEHFLTLNYSDWIPLLADPPQLVARLNRVLLSGQMSPELESALITAMNEMTQETWLSQKTRVGFTIWLATLSQEFAVQR